MKTITKISYRALALFALGGFAFSPQARADCQDGCAGSNTFLGESALINNGGFGNTAIGQLALYANAVGYANTAVGSVALIYNTTGWGNTASGAGALFYNNGSENTAVGSDTLFLNTSGSDNTAMGARALVANTTGNNNTASGFQALSRNTTGRDNTAIGFRAMSHNKGGRGNIAIGFEAGISLGLGDNNIDIGNAGADESNAIRIGTQGTQTGTFIAGISGVTVPAGVAVIVDASGHLGTIVSSARFKDHIKPMDKASEAILSLRPVSFRYKPELDPEAIPQFGLVAEDVAKVDPDLVARDDEGKPYTVRYEAVNAMLLNEFLKEHRRVEEQTQVNGQQATTIANQEKRIAALTASLREQASQIQAVTDRMNALMAAQQGPADE